MSIKWRLRGNNHGFYLIEMPSDASFFNNLKVMEETPLVPTYFFKSKL